MSVTTKERGKLTTKLLQHDTVGFDIGYWNLQTRIGRRKASYILAGEPGNYTLAKCRPLEIIDHASTLNEIVTIFNHQLAPDEELVR